MFYIINLRKSSAGTCLTPEHDPLTIPGTNLLTEDHSKMTILLVYHHVGVTFRVLKRKIVNSYESETKRVSTPSHPNQIPNAAFIDAQN